jgi:hypothetical protein
VEYYSAVSLRQKALVEMVLANQGQIKLKFLEKKFRAFDVVV